MAEIYTKVPAVEYRKLLERVDTLEKENAALKKENAKLKAVKAAKKETKTETKKGVTTNE